MTAARSPEAKRLLARWRNVWRDALAKGELSRGGRVRADVSDTGMLCLLAERVPPGTLDPEFVAHGAGHDHSLFTPEGAAWWQRLHALARRTAERADPFGARCCRRGVPVARRLRPGAPALTAISLANTAKIVGLSPDRFRRVWRNWHERAAFPAPFRGGLGRAGYAWDAEDVEAWKASRKANAPRPAATPAAAATRATSPTPSAPKRARAMPYATFERGIGAAFA